MLCPNCGNNCGNVKFCSKCGQSLSTKTTMRTFSEREIELKATGKIYCPKCLSLDVVSQRPGLSAGARTYMVMRGMFSLMYVILAYIFRNNAIKHGQEFYCRDCGNRWNTDKTELSEQHKSILSKRLGAYEQIAIRAPNGECLQLGTPGIRIYRSKTNSTTVLYSEITNVRYQESLGPLYGWLSIRDRANKHKPLPVTFDEAKEDDMTIFCHFESANAYRQICSALKAVSEENKKAGLF